MVKIWDVQSRSSLGETGRAAHTVRTCGPGSGCACSELRPRMVPGSAPAEARGLAGARPSSAHARPVARLPRRLWGCGGRAAPSEMLGLMLVAAAAVELWAPVGASQLCRLRRVRTGKVFNIIHQADGDVLYFQSGINLIKHPCDNNIALYLGQLFLTRDNFESSLLPLTIPASMTVGVPEVTSAHFASMILLLVVNGKVYMHDYSVDAWFRAIGIKHPVSHISGDNCCSFGNALCVEINNSIFAYSLGEQVQQTTIYFSSNGGLSFKEFIYENQAGLTGSLGGIFRFHSLSQVGLLLVNRRKGMFLYSEHPLNRNLGLAFDYNATLHVLLPPGLRGFLILWHEKTLLVSPNSGQLIKTVQVQQGPKVLYESFSEVDVSIHSITANNHELALLTKEDTLYYGSLEFLSSSIIKLAGQNLWSPEAALMFSGAGMLDILKPLPDSAFPAFDFQKCLLNVQATLMDPSLEVAKCKIELLESSSEGHMYTIDMNSRLNLSVKLIPRLGTSPIPLVMVSNPYSLGLQASIYEAHNTYDGNMVYKLDIHLQQQHHWGRADPNFTSSIKRPTISTLTVDIANKEISCVDMKPLSMLISVGCDLEKKIIVQNKISACSKGILDPVTLQENYSYVIEKESYDANFQGQKSEEDLVVPYPYKELGCPRLVYHDTPWKPVIELWRRAAFQELVAAEFVLREVHGLFTYSYSKTASSAGCLRQPQNWTSVLQAAPSPRKPFSWNRENYLSCHDSSNLSALDWPDAQYQILGGLTDNEIIFDQRNGFYIFQLSIVDPYYSYCQLDTTFSIYVYGAYPRRAVPAEVTIILLVSSILLAVWLAYLIPSQRHAWDGCRLCPSLADLCSRCRRCCGCLAAKR
ncbi:cation channel sperm-associated auxiliary subunit delta isoform X2 [Sciurus carolinensis]|uniref:cation channel sperm-associated auxiliary subunit delta isoform X2 n=1 Tax=Sciurus carolinensis TaxID=30640 RepID=UPI001FB41F70|nr:cation channel sperm-associated auxiliary subunit delta isoform X2 [Sciurus carolinensis]